MTRTLWLVPAIVIALSAGIARAEDKKADEKKSPPYVHTVVFYLKKDAPKTATDELIKDAHALLAKIPSVRQLWVGRPAEMATPDVAKKDYAAGLLILFDNHDGLKEYLEHAYHVEFVKRHGKNFDPVLVYDFANQTK